MTNLKHISSYLAVATLVLTAVAVFHTTPVAYAYGGGSHHGGGSYHSDGCGSCDYVAPVNCDCNYTTPTTDCGSCDYIPPTTDCGSCNYVPPVDCNCNYTPPTPAPVTLTATCTANPSSINAGGTITWTAQASGGDSNYTYSWSGAAYGSGQTQNLSYNVVGTKNATVTVHSGNQSATASCQGYVNDNYVPPYYPTNQNLPAYCYASPGTVNAGNRVDWYASASGGNGSYTYSWSGSNIINNGQSAYAVYQNPGTQSAYVTVYSNGQTVSANCSVSVNSVGSVTINQNPTGNLSSGVYLSTVPYTGAGPNWKISLFVLGLVMWSAFAAFIILKKNGSLATAGVRMGTVTSMTDRIEQFKKENLARKNS